MLLFVAFKLDARAGARQDNPARGLEFVLDKFPTFERQTAGGFSPRVTAVVVVGGGVAVGARLDLCLRSALVEPMVDELVVVEHGVAPNMQSALRALQADRRDVRQVETEPAASAAASANAGAAMANGRWLLFLDSQVVLQRGAVARMLAAGGEIQSPWIVGGRLTDVRGRPRHAPRARRLDAWSSLVEAAELPGVQAAFPDAPVEVASVSGAMLLIARQDFHTLGGFDADFETDGADLDLCRRATAAGHKIIVQPSAAGVQLGAPASEARRRAQGLARFAAKSASTPLQKAFAAVAAPALTVVLTLREFVLGRPPAPRR